jgi:copper chaperone CopZ
MDIANVANLANPEAAVLETKNIAIEGLTDQGVRNLEEALRGKPGVKQVLVDRVGGIASITFDTRKTNFPEIHDTLLESGYRPGRTAAE